MSYLTFIGDISQTTYRGSLFQVQNPVGPIKLALTPYDRSEWVEEMKALMAAKDSGKPVTQAATVSYRPDYIVRFVEASTGEELYGEPVDYAPGQEITRAQASKTAFLLH